MFKTMAKSTLAVVLASGVLFVQGCSAIKETRHNIKQEAAVTQKQVDSAFKQSSGVFDAPYKVKRDFPLLAAERVKVSGEALPVFFNQTVQYETLNEPLLKIIKNIADKNQVGLSFLEVYMDSALTDAPQGAMGGSGVYELLNQKIPLSYKGTFKKFLDQVTGELNLSWKYDAEKHQIVFFKYETRTFGVSLPKTDVSLSRSLSLEGKAGGSVSISGDLKLKPWASLISGLGVILAADDKGAGAGGQEGGLSIKGMNGKAIAYPSLGYVSVVARPSVLDRIGNYIESINKQFTKNVLVDIKVFNVSLNKGVNIGASLEWIKEKLGEYSIKISPSGLLTPLTGADSGSISLKNISGTETTKALLQALSSVGNATVRIQGQVVAVNGQPAPFQQVQEISYISGIQAVSTANVGTTLTPQVSTRIVGFTANFLPTLLEDGRILLDYQIQNSILLSMRSIEIGDGVIQQPNIAYQALQNEAVMHDGQSLMLFSMERNRASKNTAVGVTGGSDNGELQREFSVILLTVKVDKRGI